MGKFKSILLVSALTVFSNNLFAETFHPILCKNFHIFKEIKQQINKLDSEFPLEDTDCKIIATYSLFPKQLNGGKMEFRKDVQVFIYRNYELKFICLPGWICKTW